MQMVTKLMHKFIKNQRYFLQNEVPIYACIFVDLISANQNHLYFYFEQEKLKVVAACFY